MTKKNTSRRAHTGPDSSFSLRESDSLNPNLRACTLCIEVTYHSEVAPAVPSYQVVDPHSLKFKDPIVRNSQIFSYSNYPSIDAILCDVARDLPNALVAYTKSAYDKGFRDGQASKL